MLTVAVNLMKFSIKKIVVFTGQLFIKVKPRLIRNEFSVIIETAN